MQIKARLCFVPLSPSDWVAKVFLTCDNKIAVQFKHGEKVKKVLPHGPGAYRGHGGVPHVCCVYPNTQGELAEALYELAQVWSYAGEWVHAFLYKKFGYQLVSPPATCGNCNTSCDLIASENPANAGDVITFTATITNTDGSPTKGAAPQGTATFRVDGIVIGTQTLPSNEPPTTNALSVNQDWTAVSGTHTITATYTPSDGFSGTSCSMSLTVNGGVTVPCCPNALPTTLYATLSGSGFDGTYALTWNTTTLAWEYAGSIGSCVPGSGQAYTLNLACAAAPKFFWYVSANPTIYQAAPSSCSPLNVVFTGVDFSACGGSSNASVTVTP